MKPLSLQKISWIWWCRPIVPAIQEAEVGGSLELQEIEAAASHDCATILQPELQRKTLSQKKKKKVVYIQQTKGILYDRNIKYRPSVVALQQDAM